jgi:hypothetical protein
LLVSSTFSKYTKHIQQKRRKIKKKVQ